MAATRYDRAMIRRLFPVLLVLSTATACGGLAPSSPPPPPARTEVTADPADARCRVAGTAMRQDARPVPFDIDTLAFGMPVTVTCERAGFQQTAETIHPIAKPSLRVALAAGEPVSPMTARFPPPGRIPAGSPVPASVIVRLRPLLFTSPGARDRFYDRLRDERLTRWQVIADEVEAECAARAGKAPDVPGPTPAACKAARDAIAKQRGDDMKRLEIDRRRATFQ